MKTKDGDVVAIDFGSAVEIRKGTYPRHPLGSPEMWKTENLTANDLKIVQWKMFADDFLNYKSDEFKYISAEDILYYTLFSFEQLKIDREKVEVNLFGDINDKDETFKLLYEYIRNIHIAKDEKKFIFPVESSITSENTHYTLLHSII